MYLSDGDLKQAIDAGELIFDPPPTSIDATSIDLHLDEVTEAKIWNIDKYTEDHAIAGSKRPELRPAKYNLAKFSGKYLQTPPEYNDESSNLVQCRANQIIVRPHGFLLWQTKEKVGTPSEDAKLICFVDGKSTRSRAGLVVHLTAPTIHSSWSGKIVLEIANLGPFDFVLQENDAIAQLTVSRITSPPQRNMKTTSQTFKQTSVGGTS